MKSYSERNEDDFVNSLGILPEKGYYIDIGCAWPCLYSNSAFMRDKGWLGTVVDGNPVYIPQWSDVPNVDFHCCVLGGGGKVLFEENGVPELSRVGSGKEVQTVRLMDLLSGVDKIDYLTCDLEGEEFNVLSTLDWSKYQPLVIVAEYNTHGIGEDFRVREMLLSMGYRLRFQNIANYIFTL